MLSKIKEKTQGIIATVILSLIAIPFVLWGIGPYFSDAATVALAKVNGAEISQQTYRRALEQLSAVDWRRADSAALKDTVLRNLIDQTLLVQAAQDGGYRLSNAGLARLIREEPYFQRDGRFDSSLYESVVRRQGMAAGEFEARLRRDNVTAQVQQGLVQSAFVTDADVMALARLLRQERRVAHVVLGPDKFLPQVTVSATDIEQYYQANQDSFRTPESVRIDYIVMSAADIASAAAPTEEELRQAYEADAAAYVTPEKRRISHILIDLPSTADDAAVRAAQKRAEDLANQARAGGNFAALANQHSSDTDSAKKGGDLGQVTAGVLPPELEKAVSALKLGQITDPVRTQYGFHVAKLTAHVPEQRRTFESVKPTLIAQVRKRKGEERLYELGERFRNLVYEHPESLQPAAQELQLKIQTSEWLTRSGGPGIGAQSRVVAAAFEPEVLRQERNSDVLELADGQTFAAVRVAAHKPSTVRPLDEVRAGIERTLKEQRALEQARAAAQDWSQKLAQGGSIADVAQSLGLKLEPAKTVSRENTVGLDRRLVDAVFAAPRPKDRPVYGHVDLANQGVALYALETVRDVEPTAIDAASKANAKHQLLQRRGQEYYTSYRDGLRKEAVIKINKEQL